MVLFLQFVDLIKNFISDRNVAAQLKGLKAALAFVKNCNLAGTVVNECVDGLVNGCLAAPKVETKELAQEVRPQLIVFRFIAMSYSFKALEQTKDNVSGKQESDRILMYPELFSSFSMRLDKLVLFHVLN